MAKKTSEQKVPLLPLSLEFKNHHAKGISENMESWIRKKAVPPVQLITGVRGVGKRAWAHHLSQWILCEKSVFQGGSGQEPCQTCSRCVAAQKGSWVDFMEIRPESSDDSKEGTLKIDQFRELKSKLGYGAHQGKFRILLISNADQMTPQAGNSLLKVLEEPPSHWIFFLTASDPSLLLPTLVSRCQILTLRPFSLRHLSSILVKNGISPGRAEVAAQLAQGSFGRAWEICQAELWSQRELLWKFLANPGEELGRVVDLSAKKVSHFRYFLDQLEWVTLDLLRWSFVDSNYQWFNRDGKKTLERVVQKSKEPKERMREIWMEQAALIQTTRNRLHLPLNRRVLAQNVFLSWV